MSNEPAIVNRPHPHPLVPSWVSLGGAVIATGEPGSSPLVEKFAHIDLMAFFSRLYWVSN